MLDEAGVTVTLGVSPGLSTFRFSIRLCCSPPTVDPITVSEKVPTPSWTAEVIVKLKVRAVPLGGMVIEAGIETPNAESQQTPRAMVPLKPFTGVIVTM
jgi:hypothetical protein